MRVVISGASGLIGKALSKSLREDGHDVFRLVRRAAAAHDEIFWDIQQQLIDAEELEGKDALVHLAGESIAGGRWTDAKRKRVKNSRVEGTRLVADALARCKDGPRTLLSGSAVGFYGDSGAQWVDENSPAGAGFLAEVCVAWEASAEPARDAGLRVAHPRFGVVLAADGGVLEQMLPPFKFGVGGPIGDGSQYFPWVTLTDVVRALRHLLDHDSLTGPVNIAAPNPVTNSEFTDALGDALHRPTVFRVPKFAIRAALGDMGNELLLAGQRVRPTRLIDAGFEFEHNRIEDALAHVL